MASRSELSSSVRRMPASNPNTNLSIDTDAVAFAKEAGPNWGVCLDAWHWFLSGGTSQDIIDLGKSLIHMVHVDDASLLAPDDYRDNQRLLPGEEDISLNSFFRALEEIGYDGSVSPEPLGRFGADVGADEAARMALQTTVAVMKKAGVDAGRP